MQRFTEFRQGQRLHMPLDIGRGLQRITFRKRTQCRWGHGERARAKQGILQSHAQASDRIAIQGIHGFTVRHLINRSDLKMVLQILPHARQITDRRDAKAREHRRGTNTGDLQKMWR